MNKKNNTNLITPFQIAKKVDFGLINNPQNKFDMNENILANFGKPFKSNFKDTYHLFTNVYFFDYDLLDIDPNSLIERTARILGYQKYFIIIVYPQYGEIKTESISSDLYPNCELIIIHTSFEDLFKSGLMNKIYLENDNSTLAYKTIFNFRGYTYSDIQAMFRAQNIILSGSKPQKRHILNPNPSTHRFSQFVSVFESFNLAGVINSFHNINPLEIKAASFIKAALGPKKYKSTGSIGDTSTKAFDLRWRAIFKEFLNVDIPTKYISKDQVSAKEIGTNVSANTQNNEGVSDNTQFSQININLENDKKDNFTNKQNEFDFRNDPWIDDALRNILYKKSPAYQIEVENALKLKLEEMKDDLAEWKASDLKASDNRRKDDELKHKQEKAYLNAKKSFKQAQKDYESLRETINKKIASLKVSPLQTAKDKINPLSKKSEAETKQINILKAKAEQKAEADRIKNWQIVYPDISLNEIPSNATVGPEYLEQALKLKEQENKSKAAEKEWLASIPSKAEIKAKRIEELKEILDTSTIKPVYLPDAERDILEKELKRLTKQESINKSNKRSFSTSSLNSINGKRSLHTSAFKYTQFSNNEKKDFMDLLKENELNKIDIGNDKKDINSNFINSEDKKQHLKLFTFLDYVYDVLNDNTLNTFEKQTKIETEWMENIKIKLLNPEFSKTRLTIHIKRAFSILKIQLESKKSPNSFAINSDDWNEFLIRIESLILAFGYIITYCSRMNYTYIASLIGNALYWEYYRYYIKKNSKGYFEGNTDTNIKYFKNYDYFYSYNNLNEEKAVRLGDMMIECFIRIEIIERRFDIEDKGKAYLEIRQECINEIVENTFIIPTSLPMCHKPIAWSEDKRGGFLSNMRGKGEDLIQGSAMRENHLIENRKELFESINYLDSIKFKINNDFLEFIINEGYYLLSSEDEKNWTQNLISIKIAQTYLKTPFYINTFADWRGRIYTNSFFISYQGSNLAKNLIYFHEGEVLNERGFDYLYIYGVNAFDENGMAKKPFTERINWVQKNYQNILKMEKEFLLNAKEKFTFAAFCLVIRKLHIDHKSVVNLPIFLDATCSGIQHLAALMKDLDSASRVNLIKQKKDDPVGDIYSDVVGPVNECLTKFGLENMQTHLHFTKLNLSRKEIKSLVMTKPYNASIFGMTQQLANNFELTDQAKALIKHKLSFKNKLNLDFDDQIKAIATNTELYNPFIYKAPGFNGETVLLTKKDLYLIAKIVDTQVFMMFPALKEIYNYLLDISKLLRDLKIPITWFTPAGIKITQHYLKDESHNYYMRSGNTRKTIILRNKMKDANSNEYVVDRRKQVESIIPNVIHSLDACHLMFVIKDCFNSNISPIVTVHDCFGTLPNKMFNLEQVVKKQFIYLYTKENFLQKFHKKLLESIEDNNYIIFKKGERKGRKEKIIELLRTFDNANIKSKNSTTNKKSNPNKKPIITKEQVFLDLSNKITKSFKNSNALVVVVDELKSQKFPNSTSTKIESVYSFLEVPSLPELGKLDLSKIVNSKYMIT